MPKHSVCVTKKKKKKKNNPKKKKKKKKKKKRFPYLLPENQSQISIQSKDTTDLILLGTSIL